MPRCHRRLQGWKKEGNEPMTDVERKGRTVEILPNTLENVETLRLCLNEFPMNYIFFLRLFLYILYSLEILRRDRSGQYFFRSMHSSNSKLFYLIFPFFFSWKVLGAERIHTRRIYTKRWNNPSEIRRKRRRSFLRYLGAFLENRFVRAHREREGIIPKDAKGG